MNQIHHQHGGCDHKDHCQHGNNPKNLLQFFQCCLGEEAPPISEKIQSLRQKIGGSENITAVQVRPEEKFSVYGDMVVADLLHTFPEIRPYLEELHPLGLLSPTLHSTTLELFLADSETDINTVCLELEAIINRQ